MLDPKTAEEHLRNAAVANPLALQIERARQLPPALRTAAFTLLGCDMDGTPFHSYRTSPGRNEAQTEASAFCDAITVPERERLFKALFPKLGYALARWWSPEISPLHCVGWNPRPFRLLGRPWINRPNRLHQLQGLLSDSSHFGIARYCDRDALWFALYAPYLGNESSRAMIDDRIGAVLSATLDRSDHAEANAVLAALAQSARGEHPIGALGRHVVRALLSSQRVESWKPIETLLRDNGEDESIRRLILEVAGEGDPDAFRHLLTIIREKNLLRFEDTQYMVLNWLGVGADGFTGGDGNLALQSVETFLQDPVARDQAIATSPSGQTVYLALWSAAFLDVLKAIPQAARLLADPWAERRFAAAYLLSQTLLPEAEAALLTALNDPDLRVATFAFNSIDWHVHENKVPSAETSPLIAAVRLEASEAERLEREREGGLLGALRGFLANVAPGAKGGAETTAARKPGANPAAPPVDRFDRVAGNLQRFPAKERVLDPITWSWTRRPASQSALADVLPLLLEDHPLSRLQPFLAMMSANGRWQLAELLGDHKRPKTPEAAALLITLLSDGAPNVRARAADALRHYTLTDQETKRVEGLLARKLPADALRQIRHLLLGHDDDTAFVSVERLLAAKSDVLRTAALEMLQHLTEKRRSPDRVREIIEQWTQSFSPANISDAEMAVLKTLLTPRRYAALNTARFAAPEAES